MNDTRSLSVIAGCILTALGLFSLSIAIVGFFSIEGLGSVSLAGSFLSDTLGLFALALPLYLFAESIVLFLPGFRRDLLYYVTASVLPFAILVMIHAFLSSPDTWFKTMPALEGIGMPVVGVLGGVAFLSSVMLVVGFRDVVLGEGSFATEGDRAEIAGSPPHRPVSGLLGSPASEAGKAPSTGFEFRVPDLPPLPELKSLSPSDIPGSGDRADQTEEKPVPVFFRRQPENSHAAEMATEARSVDHPTDPAASGAFWADNPATIRMKAQAAPGAAAGRERSLIRGSPVERADPTRPFDPGPNEIAAGTDPTVKPMGKAIRVFEESVPPEHHAPIRKPLRTEYFVPTDILNTYPDGQYWIIDDKTRRSAVVLQETLAEFNIEAEVTGIRKGPVVTMFELLPAPGVKLSKIVNLADNIALRLAASTVRIVAPIPGKHAVGIEVPNEHRSIVSFREIVESEGFRAAKMEIPVALGKDVSGEVQFVDLVQTPHLLIAGATGSGKSVCVNSLILSLLYRRSPNEVRLLLIDPKIVELKFYNDIPHLLTPVITEPKKAFQALQYCLCEMERRYSMLDRLGVRDIRSFNRKITDKKLAQEKLPYIVVVIDEFADLMATTGKELESTLARLAAMSRAIGIHLVLATQRPSIDVITGLIKANIPSRIAFMVAGKFDSRIIIDSVGAEKLIGRGDMLFSSAWDPFPVRIQGAYVSEEEVERVVEHVKTLGEPDYIDEEMFFDEDEEEEEPSLFDEDADDPLFEKALEIVLQQGKASASFIQRRLKIGYNRSARLVELMEEKGIVGPAQGSKPRDLVRNPGMGPSSVPGTPLASVRRLPHADAGQRGIRGNGAVEGPAVEEDVEELTPYEG